MEILAAYAKALSEVARFTRTHDPDPTRGDWGGLKEQIDSIDQLVETVVLGNATAATADLDPAERSRLLNVVATVVAEFATLLVASGRLARAREVLGSAAALVSPTGRSREFVGGGSAPEWFGRLGRVRWLARAAGRHEAAKLVEWIKAECPDTALVDAAREVLGRSAAGRSGRRWWKPLGALALGLVIAAVGTRAYLQSPSYRCRIAFQRAQAIEAATPDRAGDAYLAFLKEFAWVAPVGQRTQATLGWWRSAMPVIPEPIDLSRVEEARRMVARYRALPEPAQTVEANQEMERKVLRWSDQLGAASTEALEAAVAVLDAARGSASTGSLAERYFRLRRRLAASLEKDWPQSALHHYVRLTGDPDDLGAAKRILDSFSDSPPVLHELRDDALIWTAQAQPRPELAEAAKGVLERLNQTRDEMENADRTAALKTDDRSVLEAALIRWPNDQGLLTARAIELEAEGDSAGASAILDQFGPVGRRIASARRLTAGLLRDEGRLPEAEAILQRYVADLLPPFQTAQRAYSEALATRRRELEARVERHDVPTAFQGRTSPDDATQKWVDDSLRTDPTLLQLKAAAVDAREVVPASLDLGMVRLERATALTGKERDLALQRAERAFLAIRDQAEDMPDYHLGLGEVYHQLGKPQDGEAEFKALLDRDDDEVSLKVAGAYRELGLDSRARAVSEDVYGHVGSESRGDAALIRSLVSTSLADEETWLTRADAESVDVDASLKEVKGRRMLEDGEVAEAREEFLEAEVSYQQDAEHNSASANNAAIEAQYQFQCSGDPKDLDRAARYLEGIVRLNPDDPIPVSNLANLDEDRANLRGLAALIHPEILHLSTSDASELVGIFLESDQQERLLKHLRALPEVRRMLELTRREELLTPHSSAAFSREWTWAVRFHDENGVNELKEKADRSHSFDRSPPMAPRSATERSNDHEKLLKRSEVRLKELDQAIKSAHHAPTEAAANLLRADVLESRSLANLDPTTAHLAAESAIRAQHLWPGLKRSPDIADKELTSAALGAMATRPEWSKAWAEGNHDQGFYLEVFELARKDPAFKEAVGHHPDLVAAVGLLRPRGSVETLPTEWLIAWLSGDGELQRAIHDRLHADLEATPAADTGGATDGGSGATSAGPDELERAATE